MAAGDKYSFRDDDRVTHPADDAEMVTPDDDNDLELLTRAIVSVDGGDIRVTTKAGNTVTLTFSAGMGIPLRVSRVHSTGTTSTQILVLY